jgi:hypothetical protein
VRGIDLRGVLAAADHFYRAIHRFPVQFLVATGSLSCDPTVSVKCARTLGECGRNRGFGLRICFSYRTIMIYAVGAVFCCGGVMLLLYRLENKLYGKIASFVFLVPFLAIFHWISFGAGDRTGTASTQFSVAHLVNVRTPFAPFTILVDVVIVAGLIHWLVKRRKD